MHINVIFGTMTDALGPCRASAASSHAPVAALAFSQRKIASCIIDMNLVELLQVWSALAVLPFVVASNVVSSFFALCSIVE